MSQRKLSDIRSDAQKTHRNFQVFRGLRSTLIMKTQADSSSRDQKDFICREKKRKAAWVHAGPPETGGPMGQVGNWVFIAFLYCPRVEMSLRSPGKEKALLGQLSLFVTSCSHPSSPPLSRSP
jgi:hypothetical protein